MPVRHKPLSRLTGCRWLIRIIHPRKTPLTRQRPEQRASHRRGERFFPADGLSGGGARLSLVRHARRRCHPAGLSFSHRGQTAGCSKGVRGGLSPSRARTLCSICFRLMDRYFKGTVCSTVPFCIRFYTNSQLKCLTERIRFFVLTKSSEVRRTGGTLNGTRQSQSEKDGARIKPF